MSNQFDGPDAKLINDAVCVPEEYLQGLKEYFLGLCYYCRKYGTVSEPLQRCAGCQLVAYCSRSCQKKDRSIHKYVCKEFPVVKGKNALQTTVHWKNHIASLRERAEHLPHAEASAKIFRNPRVCNTCHEARPDRLSNCVCACVTYCSTKCDKADKSHKEECSYLNHMAQVVSLGPSLTNMKKLFSDTNVPKLFSDTICENFTAITNWNDIILLPYRGCGLHLRKTYTFTTERISYSMSLLYALQMLPERSLRHSLPLEDLTTLTVHVVTSSHVFDSESWELFMHRLPKLQQLNVVFVKQGKVCRSSFNLNSKMIISRCEDCKTKGRVITFSVQKMYYHMYFSSPEYIEPDVVVVYDNSYEMSISDKDDINSQISYRNMTYSYDTVLVLMDSTEELVMQGLKAASAARPVCQLVSPQINPFRTFGSIRAEMNSNPAVINDKHYFTCMKGK